MNDLTKKHLEDLKRNGFDVSSLENQINSNPVLDKAADGLIGGGILRQQEFSRYMTKTNEEKVALEARVKELAARHDAVDALKGDETLYSAALKVITDQEDALIAAGFNEEEVKNLSFVNKEKLKQVPEKVETQQPVINKETETKNVADEKNYLDIETFQAQQANLIYGNVAMTARVQGAFDKARKLGIDLKDEVSVNLAENMRKGIEAGKNIDQIFDEQFGFSAAEKAAQEADVDKRIKEAEARGRAEAYKEVGVPKRFVSREKHAIFDNIVPVKVEEKRTPREELLKDLPRNKFGDVEFRLLRGDKDDRISRAALAYERGQEGTNANAE